MAGSVVDYRAEPMRATSARKAFYQINAVHDMHIVYMEGTRVCYLVLIRRIIYSSRIEHGCNWTL